METARRYWLGVVSRDHVRRGVALGIAQIGHGKKAGLVRMRPGDGLVYYSPREAMGAGEPVRAFTAVATVADEPPWQADEGAFKPWRRAVEYRPGVREIPIDELRATLDLTSSPNWGFQLRRGLVELTPADFERIRDAMVGGVK